MNLLKLTTCLYLCLLTGCVCTRVKTDDLDLCYCRGGQMTVVVDKDGIKTESDGKVPSGIGALIDFIMGL
jgi:hypothetical protein